MKLTSKYIQLQKAQKQSTGAPGGLCNKNGQEHMETPPCNGWNYRTNFIGVAALPILFPW